MAVRMTKAFKQYRRETGWARFEREARLTDFNGRPRKAHRVPGTPEAGALHMRWVQWWIHAAKRGLEAYALVS